MRPRERLTYANVMATVAVFVALGGSSYAALKVTGRDIRDGSLTGRDLRNGSIGTREVRNRSLRARDLKSGVLRRGPAGPPGQPGPAGPAGSPGANGEAAPVYYAHVEADGTLDQENTRGFIRAERTRTGVYCVLAAHPGEPVSPGAGGIPPHPDAAAITPGEPNLSAQVGVTGPNAPVGCPGVSVSITRSSDGTFEDSAFYVLAQ